jgi:hypothetical protein
VIPKGRFSLHRDVTRDGGLGRDPARWSGRHSIGRNPKVASWAVRLSVTALTLVLGSVSLRAQQAPTQPPPDVPNPGNGANLPQATQSLTEFFSSRTPYEFWLTCIIVLFGLVVILLLIGSLRTIHGRRPDDLARAVIVVTVIVAALILVTAGYSNEQIAPAFGLFGTIVGYILGRLNHPEQGAVPGCGPLGPLPPARDSEPRGPTS